jgi:hypothetical protein
VTGSTSWWRRLWTLTSARWARDRVRTASPGAPGLVCLYTLIHLPLERQPRLIERIAAWLRPAGLLLATAGWEPWTGTEDGWLGGATPMWWSHTDVATYRSWLRAAGLEVTSEEFVPEGDSGHALFWARKP